MELFRVLLEVRTSSETMKELSGYDRREKNLRGLPDKIGNTFVPSFQLGVSTRIQEDPHRHSDSSTTSHLTLPFPRNLRATLSESAYHTLQTDGVEPSGTFTEESVAVPVAMLLVVVSAIARPNPPGIHRALCRQSQCRWVHPVR